MPWPAKAMVTSSSPPVGLLWTTMPSPKVGWRAFSPARHWAAPGGRGGRGGMGGVGMERPERAPDGAAGRRRAGPRRALPLAPKTRPVGSSPAARAGRRGSPRRAGARAAPDVAGGLLGLALDLVERRARARRARRAGSARARRCASRRRRCGGRRRPGRAAAGARDAHVDQAALFFQLVQRVQSSGCAAAGRPPARSMKTTGNSSPFAACRVISVTASFSSWMLSRSEIRAASSRKRARPSGAACRRSCRRWCAAPWTFCQRSSPSSEPSCRNSL